jgi:hypothetical protein
VVSPPHDRKGKKIQVHEAHQQMMTRAGAFLRDIHRLSSKLVVVTEQEADHNIANFMGRFWNSRIYYGALTSGKWV